MAELKIIGESVPRIDAPEKVTGKAVYTGDVKLPQMLYGNILRSPYPHARIKSIDVSKAEAMGAVVITFDDIPQVRYNERIITIPSVLHRDHYVLADKVREYGHKSVHHIANDKEKLTDAVASTIQRGDLVLTLGAGDISSWNDMLVDKWCQRAENRS